MGKIITTAIELANQQGWKFQQPQQDSITMQFQMKKSSFVLYVREYEDREWLSVYAVGQSNIPEDKRTEIALYMTAANYGVTLGNFELDLVTGEYHFKTSIDFRVTELSTRAIKLAIYNTILFMDDYSVGIKAILEEGMGYQKAIELAESLSGKE